MTEFDPALLDAVRTVTATRQLLVALDFDGTLAPEVDKPEDARALPHAISAISDLVVLPRTSVALVSGRALESLQTVASVPDTVLMIGSHGVEVRFDQSGIRNTLTREERELVKTLGLALNTVAEPYSGVWVENKPAGFAVHTRLASREDAEKAGQLAKKRAQEISSSLTVRGGKNILEFAVRSTTKGDAVRELRAHSGATATVYMGDDVTDEDAFKALQPGDVGVKSGDGESHAQFRVGGPDDVAELIHVLVRARRGNTDHSG